MVDWATLLICSGACLLVMLGFMGLLGWSIKHAFT